MSPAPAKTFAVAALGLAAAAHAGDWIRDKSWVDPAPPEYRAAALAGDRGPADFLEAFARGYNPGRSGQVVWAGKAGVMFTEDSTVRNHGSAWDYDVRVPYILFGPGQIRAVDMGDAPAQSYDSAATFSELIGVPHPPGSTGRAWTETFVENRPPVKAVAMVVMDQVGYSDLARYLDRMPNLARWRRNGADFQAVRNSWLPSVTAMAHAGVGTGTEPRDSGVASNVLYRPDGAGHYDVFKTPDGAAIDLGVLLVPTFAEWVDARFGNRSVVLSQVYAHYAALAMAGRGAAAPGGDKDVVLWYDTETGGLTTDEAHFRVPAYLRGRTVAGVLERHGPALRAQFDSLHPAVRARNAPPIKAVRHSPYFARWQADNFIEMVVRERVGRDDAPDVLLVNLKSSDATGHIFGHDHLAYPACLREIDRFLGMLERTLNRQAGPGTWAVAVTADHGLAPDDAKRRVLEELQADLNRKLDAAGDRDGVGPVASARAYQLYLDPREMAEDGATKAGVRDLLARDPDVMAAWTEDEVARVQVELKER